MSIPEATLESWSHLGSVQQSAATYQAIRSILEDSAAPYANRSFHVFLQGSYGNDTNIRADSDVDIVICTTEIFYYDIDNLQAAEKLNFNRAHPGTGSYSFKEFKEEVVAWLVTRMGNAVEVGSKAIHLRGDGNRRNVDVLVSADYRHYWSYKTPQDPNFSRGVVFWKLDGTRVVNYPKQHSENCTSKHQDTLQWFKPMVRVLKNMRKRMVQDGALNAGVAPSYYLEGLLSNVPDDCFGYSFELTFLRSMDYLKRADRAQMTCANGIHWLVRDGYEVCWSSTKFETFIGVAESYWSGGG